MYRKYLLIYFILISNGITAAAQSTQLTAEQLYEKARSVAFEEQDYQQARTLVLQALEEQPDNQDFRLFLSRLYAWDAEYDNARRELLKVLKEEPENREAFQVIISVELWSGNNEEVLKRSREALNIFPGDKDFIMAQASAYLSLEKSEEATKLYQQLLNMYPRDSEILRKVREQKLTLLKNNAEISYRTDQFTGNTDSWNFLSIQIRRLTAIGPVIGKMQYADRFSIQGVQWNLETYPTINNSLYAHLSGGYSGSSVYPQYRIGFSLYQTLPSAFEIEAGIQYLEFEESKVHIYQASLSKYIGNNFISGRTYYVPSAEGGSYSFLFMARRYLNGNDKYIGISSGFGSASANIIFSEDIRRFNSWFAEIKTEFPLTLRLNLGTSLGYVAEEYIHVRRSSFRGEVSVSYKF